MLRSLIRSRNIESLCRFSQFTKKHFSVETGLMEFDDLPPKPPRSIDRYREKKEYQNNFIENLFLGIFEPEVLEYPQIRTLKEVNDIKKHKEDINNFMLSYGNFKPTDENGKISKDILAVLKEKELLGMKIKFKEEGLGYFESESSYIQESLSTNMSLSKTVAELENFGYQIINLFGTESQREEYLSKFLNGDCVACLAHLENNLCASMDGMPLSTTAHKLPDNNYIISGQKTLVYNPGFSNVIIVTAKTNQASGEEELDKYTVFIVDKNCKGVTVLEPLNKIGLKGVEICDVVFDNVIVPESNIVGSVNNGSLIVKTLFSHGNLSNGAQCIGMMRKMINDLINHIIFKSHFNKPLYKYKYVQGKIGEMMTALYSAESMTYLLTGRMDSCDNINLMLESFIVKIFTSEALNFILKNYMQFMGREEVDNREFIENVLVDSYFFSAYEDPNSYLKMLLATTGIKYVLSQPMQKRFRPKNFLFLQLAKLEGWARPPKKLKEYLHLTFEEESEGLEEFVGNLNFLANKLIKKHGNEALSRTGELIQLGELVIIIYKLAAVLGRASRSYCIGLRNAETEILMARNIYQNSHQICRTMFNDLRQSSENLADYRKMGRCALESSKFLTRHPAGCYKTEVS